MSNIPTCALFASLGIAIMKANGDPKPGTSNLGKCLMIAIPAGSVIGGFMTFTNSYVMTEGGPNNATLFVNYLIYRDAFQYNEFGYASALAWIVFVVLAVFTLIIFRFFGKKVYYGGKD